jgi:hypothetical protein
MYRTKETITELWAIIDNETSNICMSRGGSSSKSKIMVYENVNTAQKALNSSWTKQVIKKENVHIKKIYG